MTAQEIKNRVEAITDLSLGTDFIDYLNEAQQAIFVERDWAFLIDVDTSNTLSSGDDWDTLKDLPTDFGRMLSMYVDDSLYIETPYVDRQAYKDGARRYYIDHLNSKFAFLGNTSGSYTVYLYYLRQLTDLTLLTETPSLPTIFHRILGFKVAIDYLSDQESEEGSVTDKIVQRLQVRYARELNNLVIWDAHNQSGAMNFGNESIPNTRGINDGVINEL